MVLLIGCFIVILLDYLPCNILSPHCMLLQYDSFFQKVLMKLYEQTLKALGSMPQSAQYRIHTEQITKQRLGLVEQVSSFKASCVKDQNLISHLLPLHISKRSSWEKLLKYQANSFCVNRVLNSHDHNVYKPLILQGEIWC